MIGVSDKALAICNDHYDSHKEPPKCCIDCPIESACRLPKIDGQAGLEAWRDSVNSAADMLTKYEQ